MATARHRPDRHVVVVGGGVIGVATAYYFAQRGVQVTLVEQNQLCEGSSQGNAGQITPGHLPLNQPGTLWRNLRWLIKPSSPLYVPLRVDPVLLAWLWRFHRACRPAAVRHATEVLGRLGRMSFGLFEQLAEQLDFDFHVRGRLEVCRTPETLAAVQAEASILSALGFPSELLTGDELRRREPVITGPVAGAVYHPLSAHCNPQRFVLELAAAATDLGAQIRVGTPVTAIHRANHGRVRVVTAMDQIEADVAILACGSWSPRLTRPLRLRLPIAPGKGYHVDVEPLGARPKTPVVLVDERIFVTPIDDHLRLAGTMELSGFNLKQHPARLAALTNAASRYLSGIDTAPIRSRWCHLRPMSPDGLPIIGPISGAANIWVAAGHGMLGLTQGPATGKLLTEAILDGQPTIDLQPLRPARF